ncbi:MAG: SIS domain-containing protein [Clostridia bacterium]|nr:SIS domain-containing protein [Clostridia bacterium]
MDRIGELTKRYPALAVCRPEIAAAVETLAACYRRGGKLLICGNGGSAADANHITGELMKGFLKKRPLSDEKKTAMRARSPEIPEEILESLQEGLPAIPLAEGSALLSAFSNDVDPRLAYAQGVNALGREGDVLLAISTSGNAQNCVAAALTAKALGLTVLALTGEGGGKLREIADLAIRVPANETFKVQELHLPVYHALCAEVEERFFAE